ncbi:MAG: hypothetical protein COA31_007670 [Flavobacteriales bacterium]|nr:hypothetical protein [Flavobacteriales bacterium]
MTVVLPVQVGNIDSLVEETKLCPDRIKVLLHQIYSLWIFDELNDKKRDSYYHKEGWVNLSGERLMSLLTNQYTQYDKFLEDNRIIEIKRNHNGTKSYVSGERCTPYRINPRLLKPKNGRRFKHERITDYKTLKAIQKDQVRFEKEQYSDEFDTIIPFCSIHNKMEKMLSSFYFDTDELSKFITKVGTGQITLKRKSIRGIIDAEMTAHLINDNSMHKPIVCAFGERFHSVFSRLPREYRYFMRIKNVNEPLCSVDISNCQPYLVALIVNYPDVVRQILPDFSTIIDKISQLKLSKAIQYMDLCAKGEIYEFWLENRHTLQDRDDAKEEFIKRILFDSEQYQKKKYKLARETFKTLFADVAEAVSTMKTTDENEFPLMKELFSDKKGRFSGKKCYHKLISCMCQRLESRLITGLIVPALIKQDVGPFLTIHDSVILPESKYLLAKKIIEDCFKRLGVKPPTVKIDHYGAFPDEWL